MHKNLEESIYPELDKLELDRLIQMAAIEVTALPEDPFAKILRSYISQSYVMNFGSAHYNFHAPRYFPADLLRKVTKFVDSGNDDGVKALIKNLDSPPLEENVRKIINEETSIDLERYDVHCPPTQTRGILHPLFKSIAKRTGKKIAIPLPNWHFWTISGKNENLYTYFAGENPEELIKRFEKTAKSNSIGALVLLSPSNPLLYELSKENVEQIEKIANKRGIEIIVDDVMRGTRPEGNRESIASWFERPPYVVEGFGKRLGKVLSGISYILVPRGKKIDDLPKYGKNDEIDLLIKSSTLDLTIKYSAKPAIRELERRNIEFDEGFLSEIPDVEIERPYSTFLVSLISLPKKYPLNAMKLAEIGFKAGIMLMPINAFYPDNYRVPRSLRNKFRITVGHIESKEIYHYASALAYGINLNDRRK